MGGFYILFSFSRVRRDLSCIDQIHAVMASENRQLIFNRWENFIPPKKKKKTTLEFTQNFLQNCRKINLYHSIIYHYKKIH